MARGFPLVDGNPAAYRARFRMTNVARTPGTHPARVSSETMMMEPHPLSKTARGGRMMHRMTLPSDISFSHGSAKTINARDHFPVYNRVYETTERRLWGNRPPPALWIFPQQAQD
jgi:hypothetical protein